RINLEFGEISLRREQEHSRVPEILSAREESLRLGAVGLFHKGRNGKNTGPAGDLARAPDVAVAGFGPVRGDAECDETAFGGGRRAGAYGRDESGHIVDDVI